MEFSLNQAACSESGHLFAYLWVGKTSLGSIRISKRENKQGSTLSFDNTMKDKSLFEMFDLNEVTAKEVADNFPLFGDNRPFFARGLTIGDKVVLANYDIEAFSDDIEADITFCFHVLTAPNGKKFVHYTQISFSKGKVFDQWYEITKFYSAKNMA